MKRATFFRYLFVTPALLLCGCGPSAPKIPQAGEPIQIPPAQAGDWWKHAHEVRALSTLSDVPVAETQLAFAWEPRGLRVQVTSIDNTPVEAGEDLWNGDSVELFISSAYGSEDRLQFIFTAGRSPEQPRARWRTYHPKNITPFIPDAPPEVETTNTDGGYAMEILIPWSNFKNPPKPGDVIGVQVFVNDALALGTVGHAAWLPNRDTGWYPEQMQKVKLAPQADPPEIAAAHLQPRGLRDLDVRVESTADDVGKEIDAFANGQKIGSAKLAATDDTSGAAIALPAELIHQPGTTITVTADGRTVPALLTVPDLAPRFAQLVRALPMAAKPAIFDTPVFPRIDFANREAVGAALGAYTLKVRYFDAQWNEATTPTAPGRYGALVDFSTEGVSFTRKFVLYKTPQPIAPQNNPADVSIRFPATFGLPADIGTKEQWNISDWGNYALQDLNGPDNSSLASLVAALHDASQDPAKWHGFSASRINTAWWEELDRRLGLEKPYAYLDHLPADYDKDSTKKWPLLIFLHGALKDEHQIEELPTWGPFAYLKQGHDLPMIVVAPKGAVDQSWNPARVLALIKEISTKYRVDPKRIYVTGLSRGARGTWDVAATYPDLIAAAAPVAGYENPGLAERLKKMPIWVFHGTEDTEVPTRYGIDLINALTKAHAPVKYTLQGGMGHGSWDIFYCNPEFYAWLLQQHLN